MRSVRVIHVCLCLRHDTPPDYPMWLLVYTPMKSVYENLGDVESVESLLHAVIKYSKGYKDVLVPQDEHDAMSNCYTGMF